MAEIGCSNNNEKANTVINSCNQYDFDKQALQLIRNLTSNLL